VASLRPVRSLSTDFEAVRGQDGVVNAGVHSDWCRLGVRLLQNLRGRASQQAKSTQWELTRVKFCTVRKVA